MLMPPLVAITIRWARPLLAANTRPSSASAAPKGSPLSGP